MALRTRQACIGRIVLGAEFGAGKPAQDPMDRWQIHTVGESHRAGLTDPSPIRGEGGCGFRQGLETADQESIVANVSG